MKNHIRSAPRYAPKTPNACTLQDEELIQILQELLIMEDVQLTDDECDKSTDLTNINYNF